MLISVIAVIWAVTALSATPITIKSKRKAVIPNDVLKISAINTEQTLKKGRPVETITIKLLSGDWVEWSNNLPSGLTATLPGKKTGTPSGLKNGIYTYSVKTLNDVGSTEQAITLKINGSSVDKTS